MAEKWEAFIDGLKDEAGKLAKEELKKLINGALKDKSAFVRDQGEKWKDRLRQLADGEIKPEDFKIYARNVHRQAEMDLLKEAVTAKAAGQRFIDGVKTLVIDGLLDLL